MKPSLTIVLPAHDAGPALVATTARVVEVARTVLPDGDRTVVVVDDGSTDGSVDALRAEVHRSPEAYAGVAILAHATRRGKGAALRTGLTSAPATWMGFCDADGDIDPGVLVELAAALGVDRDAPNVDAACAVKTAAADLPALRRLGSVLFSAFRRAVLPLGIADSQTGAKLFVGEPLQQVLPQLREDGFAFDLEVLAALRDAGHGRFVGVTTQPRRVSSSSVTAWSVVQLASATIRLAVRGARRRRSRRRASQ